MHPGFVMIATLIVVIAPPILWVVWWLVADLSVKANGTRVTVGRPVPQQRQRAA